jgi:hypothetical protein
MANQNLVQKLVDTNKRAIVKMTGTFDGTGQETGVIKIDVSSLALTLNANNLLMSSNTHPKSSYRIYPTKIIYNVAIRNGHARLFYDAVGGSLDGTIATLSGAGVIDTENIVISNPLDIANSNGDICLSTLGAQANDAYTILIDVKKDARDYDQGQAAEPAAFNKGAWSIR